ncbi:MAG: ribbon-helix-helix protein, CopG family [Parvibaculaceae bacterium]
MAEAKMRRVITTMRLPSDLMRQLQTRARREGRSRSNLVEVLLRDGLMKRVRREDKAKTDVLG